MAPELHNYNSKIAYNNKIDLWSVGVIFYKMLYGTFPYVNLPDLRPNNPPKFPEI